MNKVFHTEDSFLKSNFFFIFLLIFHFIAIAMDSGLPWALLYGPALFYSHLSLQANRPKKWALIWLALPFVFLSMWYVVLKRSEASFEEMATYYYPVYFALMILSLSILPVLVLIQKHKWQAHPLRSIMIQQLAVICMVISLSLSLIFVDTFYGLDFDVQPRSIVIMLMVLTLGILSRYLYQELTWKQGIDKVVPSKGDTKGISENSQRYSLPEELLKEYAERIHSCFFDNKLYLRPNLSVDLLAQETKIPRHHLSELFNAYLGKSFYQLVAEYRIRNAMSLIEKRGHSITIEALAHECGFNSKTSFNKHFKEITGSLPSEFRNRQLI